jgi:hypothetical protein
LGKAGVKLILAHQLRATKNLRLVQESWDTSTWPPPGFMPIRANEELEDAMKIIRNGRG